MPCTGEVFVESRNTFRDLFGELMRVVVWVLIPVTVFVALALGLALWKDIPVSDLLRDTTATLDGEPYVGLFSTLGIALWASSASVCLLGLTARPSQGVRALLMAGAVTSLILGVDDAFLLHETIKNQVGIPSPVTIGIYGIVALTLFVRAWRHLVTRRDLGVFLAAVALFATSVALDLGGEMGLPTPPYSAVIEDVAKFMGIVTWLAFFTMVSRKAIADSSRTGDGDEEALAGG